MPFQANPATTISGTIAVKVTEPGGAPANIIHVSDTWKLTVDWTMTGAIVTSLAGDWHVHAFLEAIGPGAEFALTPTPNGVVVPLASGVLSGAGAGTTLTYATAITVTPADLTAAKAGPGPYRLAVVITQTTAAGGVGELAAFAEPPDVTPVLLQLIP